MQSSFFALETTYWMIVAMDTGRYDSDVNTVGETDLRPAIDRPLTRLPRLTAALDRQLLIL